MRKFISESKAHTRSDIARDIYKGRQKAERRNNKRAPKEVKPVDYIVAS